MMSPNEIDDAMLHKLPVVFDEIEYAYIYERSYGFVRGKRRHRLWLMDKNKNCLVCAPMERVKLKESTNE